MFSLILVTTLTLGAVYTLVATGFVIMYRATGVLSFAQGSFLLIGALSYHTLAGHGLGLVPSMVLATVAVAVLGGVAYLLFFRAAKYDLLFFSLATIGLAQALDGASLIGWGPDLFDNRIGVPSGSTQLWGGTVVTAAQAIAVLMAIVMTVGLALFIDRTSVGLRMRAVASNSTLAPYAGVRVVWISALAWSISAGVAAAAGVGYTMGKVFDPVSLPQIGLVVFPAIIIGGMDSLLGAAVGGVLLALAQTCASVYLGSAYIDVSAYVLLLLMLWVRPTGLFGSRQLVRI
jgi:branched-chain amino acid transport system permease protein